MSDDVEVITLESGWHLVSYGSCQVSVSPDNTIHLPVHIGVDHVASGDFGAAMHAAAEVAKGVRVGVPHVPKTPTTNAPATKPGRAAIGRRGNARQNAAPRTPAKPPNAAR